MKQKIISALFLSGTMLVSNFAFAESVPETATTTTVTESVAAATEESEPTKWEKVLEKLPKLSGYLQTGWNYNSVGDGSSSFQAKRLRLIMDGNVVKNVSFRLQIEAFNGIAGSTNGNGQKNLQVMDAFVTAKISKAFQVRVCHRVQCRCFLVFGYTPEGGICIGIIADGCNDSANTLSGFGESGIRLRMLR